MSTRVDEVAEGIYRLSTRIDEIPGGFTMNQFLLDADEPLLFHTGPRGLFPSVSEAVARIMPVDRLRWISFGHFESDECGSMNRWLEAAPAASVAVSDLACMISVADEADRAPRPLGDGEVLDLGGKRVRLLTTPHVPHGWDAAVLYEESTATLLGGDLFTQPGDPEPLTEDDLVGPSVAADEAFRYTAPTPLFAPTVERLAELEPTTIACMHGSSFRGDGGAQLRSLAAAYEEHGLVPPR